MRRSALGVAGEVEVFGGRPADFLEAYATLQGLEVARALGDFPRHAIRASARPSQPRFDGVRALDPAAGRRWRAWRAETAARLRSLLPPGTFLLLPTAPSIAPLRFLRDEAAGRFYDAALTLVLVAGHAGLPAVTPADRRALHGCPLGLSLVAGPARTRALLGAAMKFA